MLVNPNAFKLPDALKLYSKTHQRGAKKSLITKTGRDWDTLIGLIGDIHFEKLSRSHARELVDYRTKKGNKTGTIRRSLHTLGAIVRTTITELELQRTDPFKAIKIQAEGKDAEETKTPSSAEIEVIVHTFRGKLSAVTSLMILMQTELGTRIGEISGLGIDDVFLEHEIPHVYFRDRPWRTLKTDESERRVPVVGMALEAMKDRLREAGCPKDIRDATQGHASGDVADTYGQGHTLKTMQGWLEKVAVKS